MMEFRTIVDIPKPRFLIEPLERMLFVGSCFADSIGQRFVEEKFQAIVNPYGTMYNPVSVLHTIERLLPTLADDELPRVVFVTLGTNHVYRLKATGEIVDNCQKRPQRLFDEEQLTVSECAGYLLQAVDLLRSRRPDVQVVFTVSPIRYRKYGYHESQLSKATLLLAVDQLLTSHAESPATYFPAYEIVLDELRDYRFYQEDMLHPSSQAVEYIWQQLVANYFSPAARQFLDDWRPIKQALQHRPFHPDSDEYQQFLTQAKADEAALMQHYAKC